MNVWLCDLTHTGQIINSDVMPAAVGGIAAHLAYVLKFREPHIPVFKYPESLAYALSTRRPPDVIGFSNYVWNFRLSYAFARTIKAMWPDTVVVFGGPNFPLDDDAREGFLRKYNAIDFYVMHEAEQAFTGLIQALQMAHTRHDVDHVGLMSVCSIDGAGEYVVNLELPRTKSLNDLPSAYLSGQLDHCFDGRLVPILQTNRGCPFSCTFCVEGMAYYTKVNSKEVGRVEAEIDYIGWHMKQAGGRQDLYIADSNFGMYKDDLDTCRALAASRQKYGWPTYINTTTGKNKKERVLEAAKLLDGALRLSGSVQSLDKAVLANIKRSNISESQILELAMQASEVGANSYSEVILGLPGDSRVSHMASLRTIVEAGFTNVYTWQLMMLMGSELDTKAERAKFGIRTKYRVLPRCFSEYDVAGHKVAASEVEEVGITSDTTSFDDYLACRKMHLIISLFYNDGTMSPILKLLRMKAYSVFDWLIDVLEACEADGVIWKWIHGFMQDTNLELFDGKSDAEAYADANVGRYVAGEVGNNLIFTHRVIGLTKYFDRLVGIGQTCLLMRQWSADEVVFIEDACQYILARVDGIFKDDLPRHVQFRYALTAFDQAGHIPTEIRPYVLRERTEYKFVQSDEVAKQLGLYGRSEVGIGRVLMKTYVGKLYRQLNSDEA